MLRYTRLRSLQWGLVAALFLFALAHLFVRGPIDHKGRLDFCDYASPWASARLWLTGQNPYVIDNLWPTWIGSRGAFETEHSFWLALLPPGAWVVLAPFAALPAGASTVLWLLLSIACIGAMLAAVMSLARIRPLSLEGWMLIALTVASAPVQTLLAVGQLSLPVIAMILVSICCVKSQREFIGGLLLGVAAAVKPQLAVPFVAWFAFFRHWRVVGFASAAAAAITFIGIIPMEIRGHAWLQEWSANIAISTTVGAPNDPSIANPGRSQMIDLRAGLSGLLHHRDLVVATSLIICMLLAAIYVVMLVRLPDRNGLLSLATLCALTLLPVYHRMYDAALLLPALAWALLARAGPLRRTAIATLICLSVFLMPWGFLQVITDRTRALDPLTQTWAWRAIISPHAAVATLATACCLLWSMLSQATQRELEWEPVAEIAQDDESVELSSTR